LSFLLFVADLATFADVIQRRDHDQSLKDMFSTLEWGYLESLHAFTNLQLKALPIVEEDGKVSITMSEANGSMKSQLTSIGVKTGLLVDPNKLHLTKLQVNSVTATDDELL
jgi:hypothetical protein